MNAHVYNFIGLDKGNLNAMFIINNQNSMTNFRQLGQKNCRPNRNLNNFG